MTIGSAQVIRPERYPPVTALEPDQPLEVDFRDQLRLLGYSLGDARVLQPGDAVGVHYLTFRDPDALIRPEQVRAYRLEP